MSLRIPIGTSNRISPQQVGVITPEGEGAVLGYCVYIVAQPPRAGCTTPRLSERCSSNPARTLSSLVTPCSSVDQWVWYLLTRVTAPRARSRGLLCHIPLQLPAPNLQPPCSPHLCCQVSVSPPLFLVTECADSTTSATLVSSLPILDSSSPPCPPSPPSPSSLTNPHLDQNPRLDQPGTSANSATKR